MEKYRTSVFSNRWFWSLFYFFCFISAGNTQFFTDSYIVGSLGTNVSIQEIIAHDNATYLYGTYSSEMSIEGFPLDHYGSADVFLIKRVQGNIEWIFFGGSAGEEDATGIAINDAQNIIIGGAFWNEGVFGGQTLISGGSSKAIFVLEISPDGELVNHHIINGSGQKDIVGLETIEDEIYLAGSFGDMLFVASTEVMAQSEKDIFIMKLDGPTETAWIKNYGNDGKSDAVDFSWQSDEAQFIISGHFDDEISVADNTIQTNTFDEDMFLAAFTITGDGKWIRRLGGQFNDFNEAHCTDDQGNIYLTGQYRGIMDFEDGTQINTGGIGNADTYLIKCDAEGNKVWAHTLGEAGTEVGTDIVFSNNKIYWSGYYDQAFSIDNIVFPESEGSLNGFFGIFSTEQGVLEANLILKSNRINIPQGIIATTGGAMIYGEFSGETSLDQIYDAGSNFFGFVSDINLQSVSTNSIEASTAVVFPNPSSGKVNIQLENRASHILLYDIQGRLRYKSTEQVKDHQLDLSHLADGIYIWKSGDGASGRIIKNGRPLY